MMLELIQNLDEGLVHDLLPTPNDPVAVWQEDANPLGYFCPRDSVLYKPCFQIKLYIALQHSLTSIKS